MEGKNRLIFIAYELNKALYKRDDRFWKNVLADECHSSKNNTTILVTEIVKIVK